MKRNDCQNCLWSLPYGAEADECKKYRAGMKPMRVLSGSADCSNFVQIPPDKEEQEKNNE